MSYDVWGGTWLTSWGTSWTFEPSTISECSFLLTAGISDSAIKLAGALSGNALTVTGVLTDKMSLAGLLSDTLIFESDIC